jgi:hypothetical protein
MISAARQKSAELLLLLVMTLLFTHSAAAANRLADSVEWAAIDAQMIVRAKVLGSHEETNNPNDHIRWFKVDLQILETIKGPGFSRLDVAEWFDPREYGQPIANSNSELLIFLDRRERLGAGPGMPGDCKWVVRKQGGWYVTHNSSEAFGFDAGMMSMTESPLSGPELLKHVRETAAWAQHAGQVPRRIFGITPAWSARDEYGLIVPMTEPFIQQMREFAAHDGTKRSFGFYPRSGFYETLAPWNEWSFPGRLQTYQRLRSLNIHIDRPILTGPAQMHEPAGRTLLGVACLFLAWPIGWIFARHKDGQRFRFASMFTIWGVMIAAALTSAWLLSYRQACSIVWEHNGQRWQLASNNGLLRLAQVNENPSTLEPRPVGIVGGLFYPDQNTPDWDLRNVDLEKPIEKWGVSVGNGTTVKPISRFRSSLSYSFYQPPALQPTIWVAILPWLWPVCAIVPLALALSLLELRKWHIRQKRSKTGYCTICGYDLRATKDRCPECGAVPTPSHTPRNT